jgi:C4-dicarboxylate transporter, DctM subunit
MITVFIFIVLLALIMSDLPIAIALGLTAIAFLFYLQPTALISLPQRMYASSTGYTLLAIPFFILAGNLMNTGGITNRIFRFAKAVVGHIPGGLGHVSVVSSMIFSGMSGSAVADAAGLGQVQYKAMVDNGYKPSIAASIVAAASTIGPVIPPSIPFVLYGSITGVSIEKLFLAGFIPGIFMGLILMITIAVMAKPRKFPKSNRATLRELLVSTKEAFLALMAPVIIIGGIMTGFFTPTEASVVVCLYALFLGFLYKDLSFKDLPDVFWSSIKQTVNLMFIMATASFFGYLTIHQQIPDAIIQNLTAMSASSGGVLAAVVIIILILGCFLEGNAIFFITIPIFMPICAVYNIDMINFGVVMTLLIMVGNLTPPVGMCLFAVSSFSKVGVWPLARESFPYIIGILLITLLIAYVPDIATWLPYTLMGK